MALTVQDDTGTIDNANAYIDVAYMTSYFADKNIDISDFDTEAIEAAIIVGTSYMDNKFLTEYVGFRSTLLQGTEWPRYSAYDQNGFDISNILPVALKKAGAEYSYVELTEEGGLNPAVDRNTSGQRIKRKLEDIDGIKEEVEYTDAGIIDTTKEYPTADSFIRSILNIRSNRVYR